MVRINCQPIPTDTPGIFRCPVCGLQNPRPIKKPFWAQCKSSQLPPMTTPCNFKRIENGWWECTNCGYVYRRPSSRAPVRLCGKVISLYTPTSTLTVEERIIRDKPKRRPPHRPKQKPRKVVPMSPKPLELGDAVHEALSFIGITPERVTKWLGRPCLCGKRQEKFNELSRWARRIISGKTEKAKEYLEELIK